MKGPTYVSECCGANVKDRRKTNKPYIGYIYECLQCHWPCEVRESTHQKR